MGKTFHFNTFPSWVFERGFKRFEPDSSSVIYSKEEGEEIKPKTYDLLDSIWQSIQRPIARINTLNDPIIDFVRTILTKYKPKTVPTKPIEEITIEELVTEEPTKGPSEEEIIKDKAKKASLQLNKVFESLKKARALKDDINKMN